MIARLTLLLTVALAASAFAADTGRRRPAKPTPNATPSIPDPTVIRQGGDTIADAVVIPAIPFYDSGTTTGYTDDYDEVCPYSDSTSPDVVYMHTPPADIVVDIDMLGSAYDTKIYVYDADLNLIACNDDDYPDYVSRLRNVGLTGGATYYLVIDGYGGESGDYVLTITSFDPCEIELPAGCFPEGEPTLVDEYEDAHNGGCNSPQFDYPFQELHGDPNGELTLCGVAGWYQYQGNNYRDTDWYLVPVGESGVVEVTAIAELPTFFFELGPQDCAAGDPQNYMQTDECESGSMTITSAPGSTLWFWVASTTFTAPGYMDVNGYDYVILFSGLEPAPVAVETASWSSVKGLFR